MRHRKVVSGFAYPPPDLLKAFIRKAMADGERRLVLVPTAVIAPVWARLLEVALPATQGDGQLYHRLRKLDVLLEGPADLHIGELSLFAADFGKEDRESSDGGREA